MSFYKIFAIFCYLIVLLFSDNVNSTGSDISIDPNGYLLYCPCMGMIILNMVFFLNQIIYS